jgi:hypothetical protein
MNAQLDSSMTASFLESGQTLASAGNVAAVVAGVAGATVHLAVVRLLFAASMLCWLVECWFAVRVRIDALLFRQLAGESEGDWRRLDELLINWGFARSSKDSGVSDRGRGAVALWRNQAVTLAIQLATLLGAIVCEVTGT